MGLTSTAKEAIGKAQALAERAGISQAALSQMETDGKRLRKITRKKFAAGMGISAGQLAA